MSDFSNSSFTVFIDADSCPSLVREIIFKKASERKFSVCFAANRQIPVPYEPDFPFSMQVCPKGKDSADNYIISGIHEGDIAVTRDLLLAQRLIQKEMTVMNDRGTLFSRENIQDFMEERELSLQMESLGLKKGKNWNTYGQKEASAFSACFCRELEKRR